MHAHRFSLLLIAVSVAAACATAPYEPYDDMSQAMEAEVEPLVDVTIPTELNKDLDEIDFAEIHLAATRVRALFRQARDKHRKLYIKSAKKREHSKVAESWFASIAAAASLKRKDRLADLYKQKPTICTACHRKW